MTVYVASLIDHNTVTLLNVYTDKEKAQKEAQEIAMSLGVSWYVYERELNE